MGATDKSSTQNTRPLNLVDKVAAAGPQGGPPKIEPGVRHHLMGPIMGEQSPKDQAKAMLDPTRDFKDIAGALRNIF